MENFNLSQLTKEMVVGQISSITDPTRLAAETARLTIITRLKGHRLSTYEVRAVVAEVFQGAVQGMVLMECAMTRGAARLLMTAQAAAKELCLDEEMVVVAAVKGISDARRFVTEEVLNEMRMRLEAVRVGAGTAFDGYRTGTHSTQSHPGYIPARL